MQGSSSKQNKIPELAPIMSDISISEGFKIINENLQKIYDLESKIYEKYTIIQPIDNKEEITLEELDPKIRVISQTQEYIYSKIIPGLKTGRIIKQEFQYIRNE